MPYIRPDIEEVLLNFRLIGGPLRSGPRGKLPPCPPPPDGSDGIRIWMKS